MTKEEHVKRILAVIKAQHEGNEDHLSPIATTSVLVAELAALWAIVEHYAPGRGELAEHSAEALREALAEALRERDEDAANARRLLDTRDALLVTIADRQRDACAAECRASALPDAEIFTNLVLGTPLESVSVTDPEPDPEIAKAWDTEIARRANRVRSGQSQGKPAADTALAEPPFGEANPLAEAARQRTKIQRGALVGVRNAVTSQVEAIREAEARAVKTLEFIDSILSETV